jgi:hypothetical protein
MAIPVVPINSKIPELAITTPNTFNLLGFDLQAGVTYQFAAFGHDDAGGTLANPDLVVTDTNGQGNPVHALIYGDNSVLSHDPVVLFTPKVSGQYDVFIGGHGGVGTYDLHANIFGGPVTFGDPVG